MTFDAIALLENYFDNTAPDANELDEQAEALRSALQDLAHLNLLALRVPQTFAGANVDEAEFYAVQERIARYSGALAFLQAQHQSAAALLTKSENEALKHTYLPFMSTGEKLVGIGFSHLRRDRPPIKATPVEGGYRLHGQVPWVTGFSFFQSFLLAAVLPSGQVVYGMVPFTATEQAQRGSIFFSQPMALAAMASTNTVTAQLTNWFLSDSEVAVVQPAQALSENDRVNVLNHSFFALGCAQAGLDILEAASKQKPFLKIASVAQSLTQELSDCRSKIYAAQPQAGLFEEKLKLRAWAITLATRCAHAAITVSGGAANLKHHSAQRVYREALVFTVSGQTTAVMQATLNQLVTKMQPA